MIEKEIRKKKVKQPTQHDVRGIATMIMGPTGKTRMEWR